MKNKATKVDVAFYEGKRRKCQIDGCKNNAEQVLTFDKIFDPKTLKSGKGGTVLACGSCAASLLQPFLSAYGLSPAKKKHG